jgi:nucleoside-diphosphate-sugar epimerase
MRVVVIGATGNVGSSVVDALSRQDQVSEIVGVARRVPETDVSKTRFVAADPARDDLVPLFRDADAVVHLAWFFQPTHQPMITWRNNVVGSERVFDAVERAGVPALVYASSVGAYSPGPDVPVDESWPTHSVPTAGYGREKAYVERLLDAFEARHESTRVVRFRPAFLFKWVAASEQRRIFAGPFVPGSLARAVPVLPYPRGLRFQALHTDDAAEAYCRAVTSDVRGAFNLAAEPIVTGPVLAEVMGARLVEVPPIVVRAGLATAWHLRASPAEPTLFDLVMAAPLLDSTRARVELSWEPRVSAVDALTELVEGMAAGAGGASRPLERDGFRARLREVAAGVGSRVAS